MKIKCVDRGDGGGVYISRRITVRRLVGIDVFLPFYCALRADHCIVCMLHG